MTFTQKASFSRAIVLAGIALLIGLYLTTHFQKGQDVLLRGAFSVLPLAIFIPGILARKYRSGSLLCFVLLLYFMVESTAVYGATEPLIGAIRIAVICLLFIVAMFFARWQQRANVFEGR